MVPRNSKNQSSGEGHSYRRDFLSINFDIFFAQFFNLPYIPVFFCCFQIREKRMSLRNRIFGRVTSFVERGEARGSRKYRYPLWVTFHLVGRAGWAPSSARRPGFQETSCTAYSMVNVTVRVPAFWWLVHSSRNEEGLTFWHWYRLVRGTMVNRTKYCWKKNPKYIGFCVCRRSWPGI